MATRDDDPIDYQKNGKAKVKEYRIIGKRFPRLDAKELVTGRAKYSGDIVLPMMLRGKILRSPYPHARIVRIDTSKAERMSGVKAVATRKDVPQRKRLQWYIRVSKEIEDVDKLRCIGDEVGRIAAVDEALAGGPLV